MTKLTTELLEKFVNDIKTDGMCEITDSQVESALIRLLAYEQAAEKPYGYLEPCDFPRTTATVYPEKDKYAFMPLYAAPVLPKQPETVVLYMGRELISKEGLELIRDGVSEATQLESMCMASAILGGSYPAQPVIPGQLTQRMAEEKALSLGAVLSDDEADAFADGWNACRSEMLKAQQNEPQNIPENIPAQPVIPERQAVQLAPHIYRELVNDLRDVALEYHSAQQLRERISRALSKAVTAAHPHLAQPVSEPYKSAANDIIAERQRQISEEGWTPEHDDKYNDFQLALAAAGYAQNVADYAGEYCQPHSSINWTDAPEPEAWPWSPVWWKPTNPRRDLVKAGALILAEIERLDRAATAQEQK